MLPNLPPVTRSLILTNVAVFLLQSVLGARGEVLLFPFMLWPWGEYPLGYFEGELVQVGFLPWQLLTYGFLHGGLTHLLFNMLGLWMFGADIERFWGSQRFGIYYFSCVAGAGLSQLAVNSLEWFEVSGVYPTVGASGGIFGLLLAFGMMFPSRQVMLLIPPIPMQAKTFVVVFGALELLLGVTGTQTGVAHFAHLGGMLFGFLLIQYWRGRWPFERRR